MKKEAIVIGASAGGMEALRKLLSLLKKDFKLPVVIVQHTSPYSDNYIIKYTGEKTNMKVKEADDKDLIQPGTVYFAPPNYHILIEKKHEISLSTDAKINYSRPAIDILFETAAEAYKDKLIGIILTGASSDGSKGIKKIKEFGGLTIAQDPKEAEVSIMPLSAIETKNIDFIFSLEEIADFLNKIS